MIGSRGGRRGNSSEKNELPSESCRPKIQSFAFPQSQAMTRQHKKQKRAVVEDEDIEGLHETHRFAGKICI